MDDPTPKHVWVVLIILDYQKGEKIKAGRRGKCYEKWREMKKIEVFVANISLKDV